jgi:hypothetical protein
MDNSPARVSRRHGQRDGVNRYIAHQAEHHRTKPYRDELIELLTAAEVEYDEQYLD